MEKKQIKDIVEDTFNVISDKIITLENSGTDIEYDNDGYSFEINFKNSHYLISFHQTNNEIWYASGMSGAYRFKFDYEQNKWLSKNQQELFDIIFSEIKS